MKNVFPVYLLALVVLVLDQATKYTVLNALEWRFGDTMPVFGPLSWTLVENPGVSLGMFQFHTETARWTLTAFEVAVVGGLAFWIRGQQPWLSKVAVGLIMGGAMGNIADRIARGVVTDFVDVRGMGFPWIFNLGDSAITIGVAIMLVETLIAPPRYER
jgi:signal peptidase II